MAANMKKAYLANSKLLFSEEKMKAYGRQMYHYINEVYPKNKDQLVTSEYYIQKLIEQFMTTVKPDSSINIELVHEPNRDNSQTYMNQARVSGTGVDAKMAAEINNCFIAQRLTINKEPYQNYKNIPLLNLKVNKFFYYDFGNVQHSLKLDPDNLIVGEDYGLRGMKYLKSTKDSDVFPTTLFGRNNLEEGERGSYYYEVKTRIVYPKKLEEK